MKVALYIEDGREQIVLTPETPTEKGIVGKLHDGTRTLNVYQGEFYACQGGWSRHNNGNASTIIVLDRAEPPQQDTDR
jgi:hypothetical protein